MEKLERVSGGYSRHVKKGEILTVGHTHLPAKNLNGSAPHIGLKRGTAAAWDEDGPCSHSLSVSKRHFRKILNYETRGRWSKNHVTAVLKNLVTLQYLNSFLRFKAEAFWSDRKLNFWMINDTYLHKFFEWLKLWIIRNLYKWFFSQCCKIPIFIHKFHFSKL